MSNLNQYNLQIVASVSNYIYLHKLKVHTLLHNLHRLENHSLHCSPPPNQSEFSNIIVVQHNYYICITSISNKQIHYKSKPILNHSQFHHKSVTKMRGENQKRQPISHWKEEEDSREKIKRQPITHITGMREIQEEKFKRHA